MTDGIRVYLEVLDPAQPPAQEFETLGRWLEAMPETTPVRVEQPEQHLNGVTYLASWKHTTVGAVLDAMAMNALIHARLVTDE